MKKHLICAFAAAAALTLTAGTATATAVGTPANVTVEVAGGTTTLVPQTAVTTTTTPVVPDGTHACSGTSAGGALTLATGGNWSGTYSTSFSDYLLTSIKGETHDYGTTGDYWSFYVDGVSASTGVCGAELQAGDRVQLYPACGSASTGCYTGEPMQLTAPATVAPGTPFTVSLTESSTSYGGPPNYTQTSSVVPSSGASVAGATTGADGKALITLTTPGPQVITATKATRPPATAQVCVTTGSDGYCGTTKPGQATSTTTTPVASPAPAAPDHSAGTATVSGITAKEVFKKGKGPKTLAGTADGTGSGIKWVKVRLYRENGKKCSTFSGKYETFVTVPCGVEHGRFFVAGTTASWSYLLPSRLPAGTYRLDTRVTDSAGNVGPNDNPSPLTFTVK